MTLAVKEGFVELVGDVQIVGRRLPP